MANQYLVDIHDFINKKIDGAQKAKKAAVQDQDPGQINYLDGQIDELGALRHFLKEHFDLPTQRYY